MEDYGHFADRVVYMNIKPSKEMIETCRDFLLKLSSISWLSWKHNEKGVPAFHCTIVSKLPNGKFEEIWPFLIKHPFKFQCFFDNITIMRWDKDKWILHKCYPLNDK
ncbi:2'-5' RNA ligase family protein [Clostridium thermarum]|uniref:2'-5' RNA ligase family protein n=1 Tax=Clostridium thermarum TaxID=1716543 RepID=UPI0015D672C2|nr:2'-5' RNA ligase family protein [Clostridium thermarum]